MHGRIYAQKQDKNPSNLHSGKSNKNHKVTTQPNIEQIIQRITNKPESFTKDDWNILQKTIGHQKACALMKEVGLIKGNPKPVQRKKGISEDVEKPVQRNNENNNEGQNVQKQENNIRIPDKVVQSGEYTYAQETNTHLPQHRTSTPVVLIKPKSIKTRVNGLTHLVFMNRQTIYGGTEGPEVSDGQLLEIDPDNRILSRRGPNQEAYGEADRHGEHIYPWVRVVGIGKSQIPDNVYIREDTIDLHLPSLIGAESSERRKRYTSDADFMQTPDNRNKNQMLNNFTNGNNKKNKAIKTVSNEIDEIVQQNSIYRDWYHDISSLMTMLNERRDLPKSAMVKLLKFVLMRNQLQAPFEEKAMRHTGRQTSPLASEDYARGMRTRLWSVATKIQLQRLTKMCIQAMRIVNDQEEKKFIKQFNENFYVVAASQPFSYNEKEPRSVDLADCDPMKLDMCYIKTLQLQVLKIPNNNSQKFKGEVSSYMGAHGLRSSLGESAGIIAEALAERIRNGDINSALGLLESEFRVKNGQKKKLSSIQYGGQGLLATTEQDPLNYRIRDPLLTSTEDQLKGSMGRYGRTGGLRQAYEHCISILQTARLPELMLSNFKVFNNLIGENILTFFGHQTPAQVTALLTDTLNDVADLMLLYLGKLNIPADIASRKFLLERYYEKMQTLHEAVRFQLSWMGGDPKLLHEGISYMLPNNTLKPTSTHVAPHGLAMIDQVNRSLEMNTTVGILKNSYYETPGLFNKKRSIGTVEDMSVLDCDLIVLEPHPNNAEERSVAAHDPVSLLKLLEKNQKTHTVLMDITLNHMGEVEIANVLKTAADMIKSGKLNLVLVQSGTKFLQHGMDIVSLGIAAVFNNEKHWVTFNTNMKNTNQSVPEDDALYLGRMLTSNKAELYMYLNQIRKNTEQLRCLLNKTLIGGQRALEVTYSSDTQTIYVAVAPTPACIELLYAEKESNKSKKPEELAMQDVYRRILEATQGLSMVTRSSFGFNLTNMGMCLTTIRITPGIEDEEFIEAYVKRIAKVEAHLHSLMEIRRMSKK